MNSYMWVWCPTWFLILPTFKFCPRPVQIRPGPIQIRPRACSNSTNFESNAAPASLPHLYILFGREIGLLWFINPYQSSRPLHPHPPPPLPLLIDLLATLHLARSMQVWLWRCFKLIPPPQKLTLEESCIRRIGCHLQGLENDLGVRLSKACGGGARISGPCQVRGNNNQSSKATKFLEIFANDLARK